VNIEIEAKPVVSFAMANSGINPIRAIRVSSEDATLESAQLIVQVRDAITPLSHPVTRDIHLEPLQQVEFTDFINILAPEKMRQVEETRQGEVAVWLVKGQQTLATQRLPLTVLAHSHWLGSPFGLAMEMLSAHVMPNAPEIASLMVRVADYLQQFTSDSSIDGYQSGDPQRVDQIVAASYAAMAEKGINYANPPASWEQAGQKVRTPAEVLGGRLGTCLDLSVVLAAVLEQCGLHPLLLMLEEHALVGYWREEVNSGSAFLAESGDLVNRVDLGMIGVVETTCIPHKTPFFEAVAEAKTRIQDGLLGASDIVAARQLGIRPLPAISHGNGVIQVHEYKPAVHSRPRLAEVPAPLSRTTHPRKAEKEPPTRVRHWKNRLLDLSLRNRLIHFTPRSSIELILSADDLPLVEDLLNAGHALPLHPADAIDDTIKQRHDADSVKDMPLSVCSEAFKSRKILYGDISSESYQNELQKVAYRARSLEEETGANNLYITLGLLEWKLKERVLLSPLILVPVRLVASRRRGGTYSIVIDEAGESTPNYCLLEKLRLEFGIEIPGLQQPVEDASGIDLQAAFDAVRQVSLETKADFQVRPVAYLGSLQFNKFRLWKDLDEHWEKILQAPLARHLALHPTEPFVDPVKAPSHLDLDELGNTCPIPADGSQLKAIGHALAGRTFVLEGPPGTGKSQTISNLLAQAIFQGKRVLFVAEKRVALEVVSNRVRELGLGEFMLDLHDQKSKPSAVQSQVRAALESSSESRGDPIGLSNAMETLKSAQSILAQYARRLHARNSAGYSLYSATEACIAADPSVRAMPIPEHLLQAPAQVIQRLEEVLRWLPAVADPVFPSPHAPWRFLEPRASGDINRAIVVEAARYLHPSAVALASGPAVVLAIGNAAEAMLTAELVGYTIGPDTLQVLAAPSWQAAVNALGERVRQITVQQAAWPGLREDFWDAAVAEILGLGGEIRNAGFFSRRGLLQQLCARLRACGMQTPDLDKDAAEVLIGQLGAVKNASMAIASELNRIPTMSLGAGWTPLRQAHREAMSYRFGLMQRLVLRLGQGGAFALRLREWLASGARLSPEHHGALRNLSWALGRLGGVVHPAAMQAWVGERGFVGRWLDSSAHRRMDDPNLGSLSQWLALVDHLTPLVEAGMTSARAAILDGAISSNDAVRAWKRGLEMASRSERSRTAGLEVFNAQAHNRSVERFTDSQDKSRALLAEVMAGKVVEKRSFDGNAQAGRIGALKRELNKQRRRKSVRDLMSEYGDLITEAMPVVLVSPDSLSRFFSLDGPLFDIIVFDEASQVRVSDAIGAIGRARSVVVVGDSKQMPPTSFLQTEWKADDSEQEQDVVDDEESILVECVQAGVEQQWLTWHYRSQDEGLIAFSNQHYYEGRLCSFPTPPSPEEELGVSLRRVQGVFYRTGPSKLLRTNPVEAQAIVDEVKRRFNNSPDSCPSLGIITFNIQQRAHIEALLRDTDDERIIEALESRHEGLFVKNLENVQGDERDVILFSTAFSVNDKGVLPLQFGPLNRQGGERRLNVAVTRARRQVIVFSSFDPSQLRAEETSSVGIQLLRAYLDAAQRGADAMRVASRRPLVDHHRDEMARRLGQAGLAVRKDVGISSFRVDIELALQERPEQPCVALLLDGESWYARSTVSDRDGMPALVLGKMMRWPVVERVWMPEWLADPEAVIARLAKAVHAPPARAVEKKRSQTLVMSTDFSASKPEQPAIQTTVEPSLLGQTPFQEAIGQKVGNKEQLDALQESYGVQKMVVELANRMLEVEGPVHEERLARFLMVSFGIQQLHKKRKDEVLGVVEKHIRKERDFFWPAGMDEATWVDYRPDPEYKRALHQIELVELGNAMADLGKKLGGGFKEELFRQTLGVFGIQRLTAQARERLEASLALMVERSRLVIRGDEVIEVL